MKYYNITVNGVAYSVSVEETAAGAAPVAAAAPAAPAAPKAAPAPTAAPKAAAYTAEVCSAANAVACGAADLTCDAANVRASVVAALELLSTKRAARLPKKHGNMAL